MKNNNDKTAKYYDTVSRFTKNADITIQEVELIKNFVDIDSNALEIGSGTGRHAIHVASIVKSLRCIDSSEAMSQEAQRKLAERDISNVEIINSNFLEYSNPEWDGTFNFIYLMWNTYNEIVLTEGDTQRFFQQCKRFLVPGGKILINIDDSKKVDPSCFDFHYEMNEGKDIIRYSWQTSEYEESTNTSTSLESIKVNDDTFQTEITQRYWNPEQIMQLAQQNGFVFMRNEKIQGNDELYMIFRG